MYSTFVITSSQLDSRTCVKSGNIERKKIKEMERERERGREISVTVINI